MSKVLVMADKNGNVIGQSEKNPEYGYVRVEQIGTFINDQGWLRVSRRSALIKGLVKDLEQAGFTTGKEIDGKIVVVESLAPFNPENPDRDLKLAGETGVICRYDDQPIYRQSFYTPNMDAKDTLMPHTNADEIREVQAAQRILTTMSSDKERATL